MKNDELFSLRRADQEHLESYRKRLDDLLDSFQTANVELHGLCVQLSDLLKQLAAKDAEVHIFIATGIPEEKRRRSSVAKGNPTKLKAADPRIRNNKKTPDRLAVVGRS